MNVFAVHLCAEKSSPVEFKSGYGKSKEKYLCIFGCSLLAQNKARTLRKHMQSDRKADLCSKVIHMSAVRMSVSIYMYRDYPKPDAKPFWGAETSSSFAPSPTMFKTTASSLPLQSAPLLCNNRP